MKKQITLSALLIGGMLYFNSCKKDEKDTTAPIVTLNGNATYFVQLNSTFNDPGATATDDVDGSVTPTASGTVTTTAEGSYTVTYTAKDKESNSGTATRTVVVIDIAGNYSIVDTSPYPGGTPGTYTDIATLSTTTNGKVNVTKFGFYTNGGVYFNLTSATALTIPSQDVTCGSPAALRNFTGTGVISKSGGVTVLTIDYKEFTNGTTVNARGVYTKQ